MKRECYIGSMSNEYECSGRKRLQYMECSGKKEWICKVCYDFLRSEWYCNGGLLLCEGCKGDCL